VASDTDITARFIALYKIGKANKLWKSQKELAASLGTHQPTLSKILSKERAAPYKLVIRFCNVYNFNLDEVLGKSHSGKEVERLKKMLLKKDRQIEALLRTIERLSSKKS
jgi:hypothetical protein